MAVIARAVHFQAEGFAILAYNRREADMYRVAVIDDNEINLTLLCAFVQKLGDCEVMSFQKAREGLQWCSENFPDLVIVDFMMPDLDGLEVIKGLRGVDGFQETPILMITANIEKDVRYQALEIGATDFLTKPVDRIEFTARTRNMLALGASRKKLADKAAWLAEEVRKATKVIHDREHELLFRISRAAEFRDPETGAHIQRMAHYSHLIAGSMGLPASDCELILQAAPLHDVGKIGIPDYILLKPGALTPEEFSVMKRHALLGYDLLKESESRLLQAGATIAVSHHEKFNGSGYPFGTSGKNIPLFGRIVAVADVFDALTSERPYKKAWPIERARELLLEQRGSHFDPECVEAFLSSWEEVLAVHTQYQDAEVPML